jgi:hypothetical protein
MIYEQKLKELILKLNVTDKFKKKLGLDGCDPPYLSLDREGQVFIGKRFCLSNSTFIGYFQDRKVHNSMVM